MAQSNVTVTEALGSVRDQLAGAHFELGTEAARREQDAARALVSQIDDYLLPRLEALDAPLLAVIGGSTGAGKSTLLNTIVGSEVSAASVVRPTTRSPVLVCAESDLDWFSGPRVLPALARVTGVSAEVASLRIVPVPSLRPGLALIDAPDVDSVVESNRALANQLLAAADLWLFVTTAARYADAVPWELLHDAQARNTTLAVILNRVPPDAMIEVRADLHTRLEEAGLADVPLFAIAEGELEDGRIPDQDVAMLCDWLVELAADAEARSRVIQQTLSGALDSLDQRVEGVADALEQQAVLAEELRAVADRAHAAAADEITEAIRAGALLRGEVLARWHEFVGTGEWMRALESRIGRWRDRLTAVLRGRPTPAAELQDALESSIETLLRNAADQAAERTVRTWRALPGGSALLAGQERVLDRASPRFGELAAHEVREWETFILDLVRAEGTGRRNAARVLSLGVNGAGLAVMVAVFAHTGGLTGGEVAVAGGTSAVSQKVLEAIFGDAAVRQLAARSLADLEERVARLLANERARFDRLLETAVISGDAAASLRKASTDLVAARA